MKKILALCMALILILCLCACSDEKGNIADQEQQQAEASGLALHKIGVATYNINDAQIRMFKEYLDKYIKECFSDVTFLYSESISSESDMMDFLQICADDGVEGVMLFYTQNLKKEIEFCEKNGMYVIRASGNASNEDFQSVADSPYFLGEIGPGAEAEFKAAENMVHSMAASGDGSNYVILSGGAFMGNEMHRLRTVAFLNCLQEVYGVRFSDTPENLAMTSEAIELDAGGLKVAICPGYLEIPVYAEAASQKIQSGKYNKVLATIPVTPLMSALSNADITCGSTDCFSEDNFYGFKKGKISYIAGKYQSEIGPAFAALYNAITGYADVYRDNGKAFRLQQGFWIADSSDSFDKQYALAGGAVVNAYNYEDLYSVIISINPDATYKDFTDLVSAWTYEECINRRTN